MSDKKYEHEIKVKFNKTSATIEVCNPINSNEYAHGIALLILNLSYQSDTSINNVMGAVIAAIENINVNKAPDE